MQILIMTGPHSRVREIHLSGFRLTMGALAVTALIFSASWTISSMTNEAQDILLASQRKAFLEKRFVATSDADYETKLTELQSRLEEAQRDLDQLDALRTQLLRSNGQFNLSQQPVANFGMSQGGPLRTSSPTIHLGNEDEQYGVRLDRTVQDSMAMSARLNEMKQSLTHSWDAVNSLPSASPLALPTQASSGLGYRTDPFTHAIAWHEGTDFPAAYGTPVMATADGVVTRAAWDEEYGYVVDVKHSNGVVTRYAHAQELLIKQGDFVKKSQVIAKVGSTGRSTGPHLHYEVLRAGLMVGKN